MKLPRVTFNFKLIMGQNIITYQIDFQLVQFHDFLLGKT